MEDHFELLIADVAKRCEISKNQARDVVDFLESNCYLNEREIEDNYLESETL